MSNKHMTYSELLQLRQGEFLVGRQPEQLTFRRSLESNAPNFLIFWIDGPAGIGKTTLVARYRAIARELGALSALTGGVGPVVQPEQAILRAMAQLANELGGASTALTDFAERYNAYQAAREQVAADGEASDLVLANPLRAGARISPLGQVVTGPLPDAEPEDGLLLEQEAVWARALAATGPSDTGLALLSQP
ncbi:MAG: hypothetical protein PVI09_22055, partial [Anaerolineae bacterium]